jgi:protein-S-isoprenylcysteine O-methyltransferase Ste14
MTRFRIFSIVGYIIMVLALVPLFYFQGLFSWSPLVIAVQAIAVGLMVWARITFGLRSFHYAANPTEGGLVTTGPYKFIRHPIYAAIVYFVLAGVAGNLSWNNVALFAVICLGVWIRIFCEERLIVTEYPEYSQYAKRTKRIVPFVY